MLYVYTCLYAIRVCVAFIPLPLYLFSSFIYITLFLFLIEDAQSRDHILKLTSDLEAARAEIVSLKKKVSISSSITIKQDSF